jgi:hypothetical protein
LIRCRGCGIWSIVLQGLEVLIRLLLRVALALRAASGQVGAARGLIADLVRTRLALLAENALLRQQLIVVSRQIKKPRFRATDRILLVALAVLFTR